MLRVEGRAIRHLVKTPNEFRPRTYVRAGNSNRSADGINGCVPRVASWLVELASTDPGLLSLAPAGHRAPSRRLVRLKAATSRELSVESREPEARTPHLASPGGREMFRFEGRRRRLGGGRLGRVGRRGGTRGACRWGSGPGLSDRSVGSRRSAGRRGPAGLRLERRRRTGRGRANRIRCGRNRGPWPVDRIRRTRHIAAACRPLLANGNHLIAGGGQVHMACRWGGSRVEGLELRAGRKAFVSNAGPVSASIGRVTVAARFVRPRVIRFRSLGAYRERNTLPPSKPLSSPARRSRLHPATRCRRFAAAGWRRLGYNGNVCRVHHRGGGLGDALGR